MTHYSCVRAACPEASQYFPAAYLRIWKLAEKTGGLYLWAKQGLPMESVEDVRERGASFIAQGLLKAIEQEFNDNEDHVFHTIENQLTDSTPRIAVNRNYIPVPDPVYCVPFGFVLPKFVPWREEIDRIFMAMKEGGFDQKLFDKYVK